MENLKEKFIGCIYGLAIGDALGFPAEFMNLEDIHKKYGPEGIKDLETIHRRRNLYEPGTYSDDTQLSLATANGLINAKDDELNKLLDSITQEYIKWLNSQNDPDNRRAPGRTCLNGIQKLKQGIHWVDSGDEWSKGCGAAMRTAPIGLYFYNDFRKLKETAYHASACTHGNPTGIAAGIGTAYLVALAVNDEEPENILEKICKLWKDGSEFSVKIAQVKSVLNYDNYFQAIKELGEGWVGEEAVAIALYCFLKNPGDYRKAVLMATNTNGDSDSLACITGAISGAYNGIRAIPKDWTQRVEKSDMLLEIAKNLYEKYLKRK